MVKLVNGFVLHVLYAMVLNVLGDDRKHIQGV